MKIYLAAVWVFILFCIAVFGYGTAVWYCLIGGIVQIIDAIKATPTDGVSFAYGLVRVICTPVLCGITTVLLFFFSGFWSVFHTPRFRKW